MVEIVVNILVVVGRGGRGVGGGWWWQLKKYMVGI